MLRTVDYNADLWQRKRARRNRYLTVDLKRTPMFSLFRLAIMPWLFVRYQMFRWSRTGPFGPDRARYVDLEPPHPSSLLKRALHETHVKQYHEASCSVATVVNAINAVNTSRNGFGSGLLTQQAILEKVRTAHWKERMEPQGHNGRRGLPFPVFAGVVKDSLDAYGIGYSSLDAVQASTDRAKSRLIRQELKSRLFEFERAGNCLILIHFNQGIYVTEYQIPHISLVGGYDPAADRVTILDVDPDQTRPYQVSFDRFYEGLSNDYGWLFKLHGFGSGGYVFIRLQG